MRFVKCFLKTLLIFLCLYGIMCLARLYCISANLLYPLWGTFLYPRFARIKKKKYSKIKDLVHLRTRSFFFPFSLSASSFQKKLPSLFPLSKEEKEKKRRRRKALYFLSSSLSFLFLEKKIFLFLFLFLFWKEEERRKREKDDLFPLFSLSFSLF